MGRKKVNVDTRSNWGHCIYISYTCSLDGLEKEERRKCNLYIKSPFISSIYYSY